MKQPKRGSRERPPQTLDLKATEIASEPVKPEPVEAASQTPAVEPVEDTAAAAPPAGSTAAPSQDSEASPEPPAGGEPSVVPPPESKPSHAETSNKPEWLHVASASEKEASPDGPAVTERFRWGNVAAGALGAAAMLGLFLALYAAGASPPGAEQNPKVASDVAALQNQMQELAKRPPPAPAAAAPGNTAGLANLEARVAKMETAANAPRPVQTDPALAERIAKLEARPSTDVSPQLAAATAAARDAKARADAAFEASQKNAQAVAAPPSNEKEVTELATRVAALEKAKTVDADRPLRLAFVAAALRSVVERGEPFAQELAALRPLVADAKGLAPLEPFATAGVPRNAQLARELSAQSGAMMTAAGSTPRDGGLMDRLQQNAERLVRIRPISETPGDDPATVISRAEAKATNGNVSGAVAEIMSLPPAVRAPAEPWIRKAEAQQAALAAARNLSDSAVAALAKL